MFSLAKSTEFGTYHTRVQIPVQPLVIVPLGKLFNSFQFQSPQLSNGNIATQGAHLLGALSNTPKPTQGTRHEWKLLVLYFINLLLSRPRLQSIEIKLAATSKCVGIQNIIRRLPRSKWEQG